MNPVVKYQSLMVVYSFTVITFRRNITRVSVLILGSLTAININNGTCANKANTLLISANLFKRLYYKRLFLIFKVINLII